MCGYHKDYIYKKIVMVLEIILVQGIIRDGENICVKKEGKEYVIYRISKM